MNSLTTKAINPKRGEIWIVNLDPTKGAEKQKTRPVLVVSSDSIESIPLRIISPITTWQNRFATSLWHVKIEANKVNGLKDNSAIDALQIRSVSVQRFTNKIGRASGDVVEEVTAAVAALIEYE